MQNEQVLAPAPSRKLSLRFLSGAGIYLFLAVTAIAVFIPLYPEMPSVGLDKSWVFGMNQAVAQHLRFGKEIIFTYGPYASVCDRSYDPSTDLRMIWGSLLLCGSYVTALLWMTRGRRRYYLLALALFLATFFDPEILLFSYPAALLLCLLTLDRDISYSRARPKRQVAWLALVILVLPLGLLPLVKGSLLIPAAACALLAACYFLIRRDFGQAVLLLSVPPAALVLFWILAGQSVADLPGFLRNTWSIASGYTEAMAKSWAPLPSVFGHALEFAFVSGSVLVCVSVARSAPVNRAAKLTLLLWCAGFLFITFKLGFVRTDHAAMAFAVLETLMLLIACLYVDRYLRWTFEAVLITLMGVSAVRGGHEQAKQAMQKMLGSHPSAVARLVGSVKILSQTVAGDLAECTWESIGRTYSDAWEGSLLRAQGSGALRARFAASLRDIRQLYSVPPLGGSVDIYEDDQSTLIASGNRWDPRPVLQSYSAYGSVFPQLNAQHLRSANAPNWVLFKLEPIDGRLPSLDDGASWPALFDNYTLISWDGKYAYLERKPVLRASSDYGWTYRTAAEVGSEITIPQPGGLLLAQIDLKPTLLGKVMLLLFRIPQVHIVLKLRNEETESFKVVPSMMTTDFVLSPFIGDTSDFASLMVGAHGSLDGRQVEGFSIVRPYGGAAFWSDKYTVTLKRYDNAPGKK